MFAYAYFLQAVGSSFYFSLIFKLLVSSQLAWALVRFFFVGYFYILGLGLGYVYRKCHMGFFFFNFKNLSLDIIL
jgi:hypothetical protein